MTAEKCEAVFGRSIMLQVNGIEHVYDRDARIQVIHVVVARRAYNMGSKLRSKKMAPFKPFRADASQLDISGGKWSASTMADGTFPLNRRELVAGLGALVLTPATSAGAAAERRQPLILQARESAIALRPGAPETPIWSLGAPALRFKRGDELEVSFANEWPMPAALNWHGIDGVAAAEPLTARAPLGPGASETFLVPLRHAGTFFCDLRLLGEGQARPSAARALIVGESEAVTVDRDEVFLIEDWRTRPDGTAMPPGTDPGDAMASFTINGQASLDIPARGHQRLRFRFINGCQRNVIALKIENHEVQVMALDGQPAEPFPARNGALVLAPGGRADVFIDATAPPGSVSSILLHDGKEARPIARLVTSREPAIRAAPLAAAAALPSNGLPAQLDLKNALRIDVALGGAQPDWVTPANFKASSAAAFHAKAGRTVVLALTHRGGSPCVFHLHGHHFRLLDRLDDGWKPFWLDTLAVEAGQTQRIAFAAETAGRWLMESAATEWAAPRQLRWYSVE